MKRSLAAPLSAFYSFYALLLESRIPNSSLRERSIPVLSVSANGIPISFAIKAFREKETCGPKFNHQFNDSAPVLVYDMRKIKPDEEGTR